MVLVAGGGFQWEAMSLVRQIRGSRKLVYLTADSSVVPRELEGERVLQMREVSSRANPSRWYAALNLLAGVFRARTLLLRERPAAIVCVGSSMTIPVAIAARLTGTRCLFIESITRTDDLSTTGKLVLRLRLVDKVYVQWPEQVGGDPRVVYKGTVL